MAAAPNTTLVLEFEEARHVVEHCAGSLGAPDAESVDLLASPGRILAEPIYADRDFPPFRRAARDGYAVRAIDLVNLPATLQIVGEIKAGAAPEQIPALGPGQAAAIMTGAAAPQGADSVVMVEYTSQQNGSVQIHKGVEAGSNIVPTGCEAKRGSLLLSPGMVLDHSSISVAASVGKRRVTVYVKPRVAVLSTGDEIVDIAMQPAANQIRNSNSYSLAAQIQQSGGTPVVLPIARDEPESLRALIATGLQADLLLLAGGVSMGKYDLVEQVLSEFHAKFFFTGAKIQPGKPVVFGQAPPLDSSGSKYLFGLPGNPVSTMVTFELFVRPMLDALSGRAPRKLIFLHARLKSAIKTKIGLRRFLPGILSGEFEHTLVELARWQGSGDIASTALANCYVVIPPDREHIEEGEWVPVLLR
jgi:molybdopterin molybdotransferase